MPKENANDRKLMLSDASLCLSQLNLHAWAYNHVKCLKLNVNTIPLKNFFRKFDKILVIIECRLLNEFNKKCCTRKMFHIFYNCNS